MNLAAVLLDLVGQVLSNPIVVTGAMIIGVALVAGWLLATVWAFHDMGHRSESVLARYLAATWMLLSGPVLLPLSLPIFSLLRPLETPSDRRVVGLIEALQARSGGSECTECGARMDARWMRCPWCAAWAGRQCQRCERLAPVDAEICPWCTWAPGEDMRPTTVPVAVRTDEPVPAAAAVAVGRAASVPLIQPAADGQGFDWAAVVRQPVGSLADAEPAPRSA